MWAAVNADSEERRLAEQDPSSVQKKDDLPRSESGPWKIPCVYAIFFKHPKSRGKLKVYLSVGAGGQAIIQFINLVN